MYYSASGYYCYSWTIRNTIVKFILLQLYLRSGKVSTSNTLITCFGYLQEVELVFWHGNCSTFEILYSDDLKRMYETNLITLGNFYTGHVDKFKIDCSVHLSTQNTGGMLLSFSLLFRSFCYKYDLKR